MGLYLIIKRVLFAIKSIHAIRNNALVTERLFLIAL